MTKYEFIQYFKKKGYSVRMRKLEYSHLNQGGYHHFYESIYMWSESGTAYALFNTNLYHDKIFNDVTVWVNDRRTKFYH